MSIVCVMFNDWSNDWFIHNDYVKVIWAHRGTTSNTTVHLACTWANDVRPKRKHWKSCWTQVCLIGVMQKPAVLDDLMGNSLESQPTCTPIYHGHQHLYFYHCIHNQGHDHAIDEDISLVLQAFSRQAQD
jgi:hypothetical protein